MAMDNQASENERQVAARFSMAGRKALVTGGSVSIGREIALAFAEAGADVAIQHARAADIGFGRTSAAEETVAAITGRGHVGIAIEADSAGRMKRPAAPKRRAAPSAASTFWSSVRRSSSARLSKR